LDATSDLAAAQTGHVLPAVAESGRAPRAHEPPLGRKRRTFRLGPLLLAGLSSGFAAALPASAATNVSGTISSNTTWNLAGSPYVVVGDLTIVSGVVLTLEPGVVVKVYSSDGDIRVNGTLVADGTSGVPIVFTSIGDDSVGGDTNGNGPSSGSPGVWRGIGFASGSTGNLLDYVEVYYAGAGSNLGIGNASVVAATTDLAISNSAIRFGISYGIFVSGASPTISTTLIEWHGVGVQLASSGATLTGNTIRNNSTGVQLANSPGATLSANTISGNTGFGVYNSSSTTVVLALGNFWGDPTGPLDSSDDRATGGFYNPGGLGNRVSDHVNYASWLAYAPTPTLACAGSPIQALVPGAAALADSTCSGLLARYSFPASAGASYTVRVTPSYGDGDLYGSLSLACIDSIPSGGGGCADAASQRAGAVTEEIALAAGAAGTRYVGVFGRTNTAYTIRLSENAATASFLIDGGTGTPGIPTTFDARASLGGEAGCGITSYAWNFGDSATATCPSGPGCNPGDPARVAHTYAGAGSFTATLTVTDCNGSTATTSAQVAVTATAYGIAANRSATSLAPVNLATGNFYETTVDLRLPGRGGHELVFSRSYNSQDVYFTGTPLGHGWTHSFNVQWIGDAASQITVLLEDGHGETYTANGDGTFTAETGIYSRLVENRDGSLTLTRKDQVRYELDATGRLTSVVDRNGNAITCTYDGQGRLASLLDSAGRTVTLTYDAQDRLIQLEAPPGPPNRVWSFAYDPLTGDLLSVTDPELGVTRYAYDASHQITEITDPRGNPRARMVYDEFSRVVTSQLDALDQPTTFAYDFVTHTTTLTDALDGVTRYTHDGNLRLTDWRDAREFSEHFVYDADGNRIQTTDRNGNTTSYTYL
jgi:YD repeat-containing protein/parallel beta-helix repeat protein